MRRVDKEMFRVFDECGIMETYNEIKDAPAELLLLIYDELDGLQLPPRVNAICRRCLLAALDTAKGREKALK